MGLLVAILVTLAVAGSIMWVRPSRRDQRITRIRRKAMENGMRVRLLDEKLTGAMFPWLEDYRLYVMYESHHLLADRERALRVFRLSGQDQRHELDILQLDDYERAMQSGVKSLVGDLEIEALVVYPKGVAILWSEQGDEPAVEVISALAGKVNEVANEFATS